MVWITKQEWISLMVGLIQLATALPTHSYQPVVVAEVSLVASALPQPVA